MDCVVSNPRRCKLCDKAGANLFNRMCSDCWNKQIELNIKAFVDQTKKEQ